MAAATGLRALLSHWRAARSWLVALLLAWAALAGWAPAAHAEQAARLDELRVDQTVDGLFLTAQLDLHLSDSIRAALDSGIPVYFVASAEIVRPRWYWWDSRLSAVARYSRVAYQPLTRQWRLNTSSEPIAAEGLGAGLTRYYDSLAEVMAPIQHIAGWKIASLAALSGTGQQYLDFEFRLDSKRLPRTFLLGDIGERDWHLEIHRRIDLTRENPS